MDIIDKILRRGERNRYQSFLRITENRWEFYQDISYINFYRLKIWSYFLTAFSLFSIASDIFFGEFWSSGQISNFMLLDGALVAMGILTLFFTHLDFPENRNSVTKFQQGFIHFYVLFHLLWSSGISIIESETSNSVSTYLLGVFSVSSIFILRSSYITIYLLLSFSLLAVGLIRQISDTKILVQQYFPVIILILLAWITSRALYNTRLRSFFSTKEIENARNNLDKIVKERTSELRDTNQKLIDEIIERKRYEVNLEYEKHRAEEADHLKSVFLANMSHEIRTPLNGILGFGDLLQNVDLTHAKRVRYLEIIHANGQQLLKIIDDIMDISMIESNQLKVNRINFQLGHIFHDALIFFNTYKKAHNRIGLEIYADTIPENMEDRVYSDPTRIQQVLYNILSNAVKFTERGTIRFGIRSERGYCLVYVEDTGIGILPEQQDKIFERFRQGEESMSRTYGGTGLGLSISKGIIEILGGIIWLDTTYKKGARFCFSIPNNTILNESLVHTVINTEILVKKNAFLINIIDDKLSIYPHYLFNKYLPNLTALSGNNFNSEPKLDSPDIIIVYCPNPLPELNSKLNIIKGLYENCYIAVILGNNSGPTDILPENITYYNEPFNFLLFFNELAKLASTTY